MNCLEQTIVSRALPTFFAVITNKTWFDIEWPSVSKLRVAITRCHKAWYEPHKGKYLNCLKQKFVSWASLANASFKYWRWIELVYRRHSHNVHYIPHKMSMPDFFAKLKTLSDLLWTLYLLPFSQFLKFRLVKNG